MRLRTANLIAAGLLSLAVAVPASAGSSGPGKVVTASWYGPGFHGRRTASGEVFDQEALTAAHRTFPFGTHLLVTNINNGRSVKVTVNDRGPFARRRGIDLSRAAAHRLGMLKRGLASVRIQLD